MPTFSYTSMANGMSGGSSTIEAADRASAVRELLRRGVTPTGVEVIAGESRRSREPAALAMVTGPDATRVGRGGSFLRGRVMSRSEMASFVRELATALHAGLPLVPALRTIAKQGRSPRQWAMLAHLIAQVEAGKSLADAAASWGSPFNELMVNMLRAGEASGRLPEVMSQAAELLDRDVKLRRSVLGATLYPMILMALIVIAIVVIVTFIVPQVLKSMGGAITRLPFPTRVVQGLAQFVGGYWWMIVPGIAIGVYAMGRVYASPAARLWIDGMLLRVPVLGRLLRDVAVARFTRTLGTLTASGIPVLNALKITRGTLNNRAMEHVIDRVCEEVAAGKTIADPMERSGYFPPMLVQIVNLGERSGRLDELLGQAARAFDDRTETSVKLLTTALPPVLVVFAACCVGFIVLAIMLPMLQLQDAVGGK